MFYDSAFEKTRRRVNARIAEIVLPSASDFVQRNEGYELVPGSISGSVVAKATNITDINKLSTLLSDRVMSINALKKMRPPR